MNPIITVSALSKSFGKRQALKNIDLQVAAGEILALIGPSGSGKSTLLRNLSGLATADRHAHCELWVGGKLIQRAGKLDRHVRKARCRIGYIFQQFNLIGRLSVLTNVLIGALGQVSWWRGLFGIFTAAEKHAALAALQRVGLEQHAMQRASTLSGGQQQRVAIARALMQQADVILADEPIAALDPQSAQNVMEILQNINRQDGTTIIVTLHQVDYARRYCRRVVALDRGEISFEAPVSALTDERLRKLYGARIDLNDAPTKLSDGARIFPAYATGLA